MIRLKIHYCVILGTVAVLMLLGFLFSPGRWVPTVAIDLLGLKPSCGEWTMDSQDSENGMPSYSFKSWGNSEQAGRIPDCLKVAELRFKNVGPSVGFDSFDGNPRVHGVCVLEDGTRASLVYRSPFSGRPWVMVRGEERVIEVPLPQDAKAFSVTFTCFQPPSRLQRFAFSFDFPQKYLKLQQPHSTFHDVNSDLFQNLDRATVLENKVEVPLDKTLRKVE